MLIVVLTVVILTIHIIIVGRLGFGLGKILPSVVEQLLQLDTREVHGRASGVEVVTVPNHELEVTKERLGGGVLVVIQLLPHRRHIHGLLDDLRVGWDV